MSHDAARRGFLRRSITIVPVAAVAAGCSPTPPPANAASVSTTAPAASANPAAPFTPRYFNAPEWAFVQAAVARLIPADETGPGGIEAGVHEFIDRQMDEA